MSDFQVLLWDHDQRAETEIRTSERPHFVTMAGREFYPVSCLAKMGQCQVYVAPATEDAVLSAALYYWRRNPQTARDGFTTRGEDSYDTLYRYRHQTLHQRLCAAVSFEEWLTQEVNENFITLREGVIGYHPGFSPRRALLDRIIADINALPERPRRIVEVGCGTGNILLPLKHALPDIHCCGIEPSVAGISIARAVAERFHIDVELIQCSLGEATRLAAKQFDLAFTHSVLVQIPQPPLEILQQIAALTTKWIHLYEHFTDMLGDRARDFAALYYLTTIARYETGSLFPMLSADGTWLRIHQKVRFENAVNPLEDPSFVQVELL